MLHFAPQLFKVLAKKDGNEYTPELTTLASGAQVLNFTAVPVDQWDGEANVYIQVALWGKKGEQLSGHANHMDTFLFGGACKVEPDPENPKVHYYKLNVNTAGPLSRVSRDKFVPAEVSDSMESDLKSASKAAKKAGDSTQDQDDDDVPF